MKHKISDDTEQGWLDHFNEYYGFELKVGESINDVIANLTDEFNHMVANGPAITLTEEK